MDNGQSVESVTLCQRWLSGQRAVEHNEVTLLLFIRSCSESKRYREGIEWLTLSVHADGDDLDRFSVEFVNSLITFYGECGRSDDAIKSFNAFSVDKRDGVTTNALMTALSANDR